MRHIPFQSIYRHEFEVVEQREGPVSLFPHTAQLRVLLRALNLEFLGALPGRIARVDERADGFHKIVRRHAALMFCGCLNASRADQLRLFELPGPDLVARVSIVQQIAEDTRRGRCHRFRFYAGDDFFPEIRLSGKRLVFADHVLQRFSARVPNNVGEDLTCFLLSIFGAPMITMPAGPGRAFIVPYQNSVLAFTFHETATEFFITTCLTVNEMNSLNVELPPDAHNLHYGETFTKPRIRHWLPTRWMLDCFKKWQNKIQLAPREPPSKLDWHDVACRMRDLASARGHGPGSRICFADHVLGPCVLELRPDQTEPQVNELETFKHAHPEYDWEAVFTEREAKASRPA